MTLHKNALNLQKMISAIKGGSQGTHLGERVGMAPWHQGTGSTGSCNEGIALVAEVFMGSTLVRNRQGGFSLSTSGKLQYSDVHHGNNL